MKAVIASIMVCIPIIAFCQDKAVVAQPPPSQLDRFIDGFSPESLVTNVAIEMSSMVPQEKRQEAIAGFIKDVDVDEVEQTLRKAFGRQCTVDELRALADLCSTPAGRTALAKYVKCMEETMTRLQPVFSKSYHKVVARPEK